MTLYDRIENDFTYHPPRADQVPKFVRIRNDAREMAHRLVAQCPEGRELSTALTKLDEVVFWANASIARSDQ